MVVTNLYMGPLEEKGRERGRNGWRNGWRNGGRVVGKETYDLHKYSTRKKRKETGLCSTKLEDTYVCMYVHVRNFAFKKDSYTLHK